MNIDNKKTMYCYIINAGIWNGFGRKIGITLLIQK